MYNIEKIEKQWIRYKRKKIILPTVVIAFVLALSALFFYYFIQKQKILDSNTSSSVTLTKKDSNASKVMKKDSNASQKSDFTASNKKSKIALSGLSTQVPSLGSNSRESRLKIGEIIFQDPTRVERKNRKRKKNLLIQITKRGTKDIAKDIESRFAFAKDKSDSLFLAKYYYDKMEYAKAEKWALETNKLDSKIEESWLIFAKAQAGQGKRIESLKVLQAFYDESGSSNAKNLIDKIRRGKNF